MGGSISWLVGGNGEVGVFRWVGVFPGKGVGMGKPEYLGEWESSKVGGWECRGG